MDTTQLMNATDLSHLIDFIALLEDGQSFEFDEIEYTKTKGGVLIDGEAHTMESAADFLDVYYHYEGMDAQ